MNYKTMSHRELLDIVTFIRIEADAGAFISYETSKQYSDATDELNARSEEIQQKLKASRRST